MRGRLDQFAPVADAYPDAIFVADNRAECTERVAGREVALIFQPAGNLHREAGALNLPCR